MDNEEDKTLTGQNINKIMHLVRKKILTKEVILPSYLTNKTKRITSISVENGRIKITRGKPRKEAP